MSTECFVGGWMLKTKVFAVVFSHLQSVSKQLKSQFSSYSTFRWQWYVTKRPSVCYHCDALAQRSTAHHTLRSFSFGPLCTPPNNCHFSIHTLNKTHGAVSISMGKYFPNRTHTHCEFSTSRKKITFEIVCLHRKSNKNSRISIRKQRLPKH